MKKGYQKLLAFEIILFIFLFLNGFVWNVLDSYNTIILLVGIIILFKFIIGVEKDKHRFVKDVIFDILIILLIYFLLYYLFGIFIGFYKIDNYYNWYGFKIFIFPNILIIILKEYLRYQVLTKSEGNKLLTIGAIFIFIFLDISTSLYYVDFSNSYDTLIFIALTFLPSISSNIACSYIALKLGYKPNIVWLLISQMYVYLIPIVPNSNEYILSIINFIFPLIIMYKVYTFFEKVNDYNIERNYKKNSTGLHTLLIILVAIIVYLTSGYFKYTALAIASGSMRPGINKGDIVIVEKLNNNFNLIEKNTVIAYKYNDVTVVHRVVNIIKEDGKYYFYTKGDANDDIDNFSVHEENVIGVVNFKIPFIGLPTVWLNEL